MNQSAFVTLWWVGEDEQVSIMISTRSSVISVRTGLPSRWELSIVDSAIIMIMNV